MSPSLRVRRGVDAEDLERSLRRKQRGDPRHIA
jgi:hypothetical protein